MTTTTIDLHDIATVLLYEYKTSESRFKHSRLREINDTSKPRSALPPHIPLPELDNLPLSIPVNGYFLLDDGIADAVDNMPAIELASFKHPEFTNNSSVKVTDAELEKIYWQCKHHDSGYTLAHAIQLVLDNLPSSVQLRVRTSQGHTMTITPTAFAIAELQVVSHSTTYICKITNQPQLGPSKVSLGQYLTGSDGPFPWVYLVFGDEKVANVDLDKDGRVALDLASLLLGMRGRGGEIFVMERLEDYHSTKLLPAFADDVGDVILSGRIVPGSSGRHAEYGRAVALSKRVLARLEKIVDGAGDFCAYCGKESAKARCSVCRGALFCDKGCQSKAWKYHKRWCKSDAGSA